MNKDTEKRLERLCLTIADAARDLREAGMFELRSVYKPALAKLERAALEMVDALRKEKT